MTCSIIIHRLRGLRPVLAVLLLLFSGPGRADITEKPPDATIQDRTADLLLVNGVIHSMDALRNRTEAVAIAGESILATGSSETVLHYRGTDTEVIDLKGRSVFPGFTDAHVHPAKGGDTLLSLSFTDEDDAAKIQQKLLEHRQAFPGDAVVTGSGWSLTQFEGGNPHKSVIDAVIPDLPVILIDSNHHSTWVNNAALAAAGITRQTADPVNGRIERNADGEPTGVLRESAQSLVRHLKPELVIQARIDRINAGLAHLNGLGYTSVLVAAAASDDDRAWMQFDRRLASSVHLAMVPASLPLHAIKQFDDIPRVVNEFKVRRQTLEAAGIGAGHVKVFLDGGLESCTAAFLAHYADAGCGDGHTGSLNYPPAFLQAYVAELDRQGYAIHVHAIGDRTTRVALDAFEAGGSRGAGHAISHLQFVHPADAPRFARNRVAAVIQSLWAYPYDHSMLPFEGTAIGPWRYPFAALADADTLLVAGSDWPVSTANPFHALEVAVTRRDPENPGGTALLPEQALQVDQYMMALTAHGARYLGEADKRGTVTPGKLADLVVLSADPYQLESASLSDITVMATMIRGRFVVNRLTGP